MMYGENSPQAVQHALRLEGREQLTVSGVEIVTGSNLHIGQLSLEGGELHVDGRIDSLAYEDEPARGGGFFSRLFG